MFVYKIENTLRLLECHRPFALHVGFFLGKGDRHVAVPRGRLWMFTLLADSLHYVQMFTLRAYLQMFTLRVDSLLSLWVFALPCHVVWPASCHLTK